VVLRTLSNNMTEKFYNVDRSIVQSLLLNEEIDYLTKFLWLASWTLRRPQDGRDYTREDLRLRMILLGDLMTCADGDLDTLADFFERLSRS
jgi:hypothetical protein